MTRTLMSCNFLLSATVLFSALAVCACCKSKTDDESSTPIAVTETAPTASVSAAAVQSAAAVDPNAPEWKQKCPDADRQESGTVTAMRQLTIYKSPDTNSERLTTIIEGTMVDLLGAKSTWWCIDYPCAVGKLCPGWVEERNTQRKQPEPKDAGVDAADGGKGRFVIIPSVVDAGSKTHPTTTSTATTGRNPPGSRPPRPRRATLSLSALTIPLSTTARLLRHLPLSGS